MGSAERADVVIVGARCAGSPLAVLLAQRGINVCVLDRSRFPSEVPSTHVIHPSGVKILDRIGALQPLLAARAVPLENYTLIYEDARVDTGNSTGAVGAPAVCVRRITLDDILVNAAAAAGATVRTGVKVTGLIREGGRVAGVVCDHGEIRAPIVIGADGRHSTVATEVGAAEYRVAPAGRLFAWAYFEGADDPQNRLCLARLGDFGFLASPTDNGLYMAVVAPALAAAPQFLADREVNYHAAMRAWPELADRVSGGRRVGPIRVVGNWYGYFREAAGPGWALLGDAGHFKDPTPGQGITDAMRHGVKLADAIEAGLDGPPAMDRALADWWRWRDQDGLEMHWLAADMGAAGVVPPMIKQIFRNVAGDEDAILAIVRMINHDVNPSTVMVPRRLARAAAGVVRHHPREVPAMAREVAAVIRAERARRKTEYDGPGLAVLDRSGGQAPGHVPSPAAQR